MSRARIQLVFALLLCLSNVIFMPQSYGKELGGRDAYSLWDSLKKIGAEVESGIPTSEQMSFELFKLSCSRGVSMRNPVAECSFVQRVTLSDGRKVYKERTKKGILAAFLFRSLLLHGKIDGLRVAVEELRCEAPRESTLWQAQVRCKLE